MAKEISLNINFNTVSLRGDRFRLSLRATRGGVAISLGTGCVISLIKYFYKTLEK